MLFKNHSELYFQRMDASVDYKTALLEWVQDGAVAELGAGSGSLTELIAELPRATQVVALDASTEAVQLLAERFGHSNSVSFGCTVLGEHQDPFSGRKFSSIVASSVFHEVYSFIGADGLELIAKQISEALLPGGRFILRDGVKSENYELSARIELDPTLLSLAQRYVKEAPEHLRPVLTGVTAFGSRHQIAEMAFTITWGEGSFDREVEEQYQVYSLDEARDFYEGYGLKLIHSSSMIQKGYVDHLQGGPMQSLSEVTGKWEPWFPQTNALWVFEKP